MRNYIERGRLLLVQNRYQEAVDEFKKELATNPSNPYAMGLIAECHIAQKEYPHAVDMAERAVGVEADNPVLYYILGRSYFYSQRIRDARQAIASGQVLDPANANFFLLKGNIDYYQDEWNAALDAAECGLELAPENVSLINLRARSLVQLNRTKEAELTLDYALHKAPENTYAHANKGWVAVEKDNYDTAVNHFKEALRLDPMNEYAKTGLKEAIKGKNILYRYILKYFLWMSKKTEGGRWTFVIGAYLIYQLILQAVKWSPNLAPFLYPIIGFYIISVFSSWIAVPIANLFLRLHPLGKYALDKDEMVASNIVGGLGVIGIISLAASYVMNQEVLLLFGGLCLMLLIPVGGLFSTSKDSKVRSYLTIYAAALGVLGLTLIVNPYATWALFLFVMGIFAYAWVANYLISKDARSF